MNMHSHDDTARTGETEAAARLEATGRYRILRAVPPLPPMPDTSGTARLGVFLDLETTGLDARRHKVIQIAMIRFAFSDAGEIAGADEPYVSFNDPGEPIPPEITRLTGIDDAMVAGQTIDVDRVIAMLEGVDRVISHNAAFDRPFAERVAMEFLWQNWGCSMAQVDWVGEGFEGTKLAYLLMQSGWFHGAHRADADCVAALALIGHPLPSSGQTPLSQIIARSCAPTIRIRAVGAPFSVKDRLKERGYRWEPGRDGARGVWSREVEHREAEKEIAFLRQEFGITPTARGITALSRFSDRA